MADDLQVDLGLVHVLEPDFSEISDLFTREVEASLATEVVASPGQEALGHEMLFERNGAHLALRGE